MTIEKRWVLKPAHVVLGIFVSGSIGVVAIVMSCMLMNQVEYLHNRAEAQYELHKWLQDDVQALTKQVATHSAEQVQ